MRPHILAPLKPHELVDASTPADPADEWLPIMPVPDDAPRALPKHRHGKPSAHWVYRDGNGKPLGLILRFDIEQGGKEFYPAVYCMHTSGRKEWRWKGFSVPRPLYGLDRLAATPDAPVLLVEGEKAADAATALFPDHVAITSAGGSNGAHKADWMPLKGRHVLIWPDNDAAGLTYAQQVADILTPLDCTVLIIDAAALASISPNGGPREPAEKWDAADAAEEWTDHSALREAAINLARPLDPGPAFVNFGHYEMTTKGLMIEIEKGSSGEFRKVWVSAPFEILGACRDPHGREWGKFLRWRDPDGRIHNRHVADSALHGDPAAICAALASDGLRIERTNQRHLVSYLSGVSVTRRVTTVMRTGWHDIGKDAVFVLPEITIGPRGAETVILDGAAHGPYEACGSLHDWQAGVGTLACGHGLPVLAISAALAGPLLHLAGQEGGGVNFYGQSSRGKTTLLQMAASVWGRGASPGYVRAWRATANGLEGAASASSDTALVLDELGQVEPRDAAAALYALSNGGGKVRAARDGAMREPKSWRVMVLSTGELPTEAKLSEDRGRKPRAGQLVRMLDIPTERGFGVFDNSGPDNDAGTLAKMFKQASIAAYGTAGPEFVRRLIDEKVTGDDVRALVTAFVDAYVPSGSDGQIGRAAQRLGLIASAGELATALGVTPWGKGEATAAAAWALEKWIGQRGGTEPAETRQAIDQVRLFIEAHGDSRFQPLDDGEAKPVHNRLGWRKGEGAAREWWIQPQTWKAEICAGLDPLLVARVLYERGMLRRQGGNTLQCTVNIGDGTRLRAYVLTAAIQGSGDAC